jgi:hypothetical protein
VGERTIGHDHQRRFDLRDLSWGRRPARRPQDKGKTELSVPRDRVRELKDRLAIQTQLTAH